MSKAQQQLDELYLPLLITQARGKMVFRLFLQQLRRTYVFSGTRTQLSSAEMQLWVYWSENAFIPMNEQINDLILQGMQKDLFEGGEVPASFHRFMDYHQSFKIAIEQWVREGGEYRHPGNFPFELEEDIIESIHKLSLETGWMPQFISETGWKPKFLT